MANEKIIIRYSCCDWKYEKPITFFATGPEISSECMERENIKNYLLQISIYHCPVCLEQVRIEVINQETYEEKPLDNGQKKD